MASDSLKSNGDGKNVLLETELDFNRLLDEFEVQTPKNEVSEKPPKKIPEKLPQKQVENLNNKASIKLQLDTSQLEKTLGILLAEKEDEREEEPEKEKEAPKSKVVLPDLNELEKNKETAIEELYKSHDKLSELEEMQMQMLKELEQSNHFMGEKAPGKNPLNNSQFMVDSDISEAPDEQAIFKGDFMAEMSYLSGEQAPVAKPETVLPLPQEKTRAKSSQSQKKSQGKKQKARKNLQQIVPLKGYLQKQKNREKLISIPQGSRRKKAS